ncbi:flotillin family protein [Butyrivibrio proteoclasticus]|uniref:flotillin family protein n=1 Tax=Butyrivibrio proteoclasticus TaxID=43305 RepID=UPI00054E2BB7|nr:flotillin family protein [Butyrivibrio proteoclasticus]
MLFDFVTYLPIFALILVIIMVIVAGYVKAPPDRAFIISGLRKKPRILIGRAGVKIPFFERVDKLYLGQMTVDIKTEQSVPTNDFINVNVDAVAKVRIGQTPEAIQLASKNFLNKRPEEITMDLQDSLQGNMREIIGTLALKTINTDRDSFSDQVMEKASKDMNKLGIEILSCNIQNVTDENGLISDLGMDNTAKIKKDAAIAKAQADRDVAIAKAEADKAANDARVIAQTEIAEKNNALAIKQAELKREADTASAVADAAYEIQTQEQQKSIQTATVNAQIARAEREAELKQKEVIVKQQELAAEIEKKADAEKYQAEKKAEAELLQRQKKAEAAKYEQEREADARKARAEADQYEKEREADAQKAKAEAEKYAAEQMAAGIKAKYDAEAAGIAAKGKAEAEAIKARGIAEAQALEAKGLAEAQAMEKKAEAYKKYNGAAMAEMMIKVMPQLAAEIAKPLSSIDKINIYETGEAGESGASRISGNMPIVMKQVFDTMSEATGVDFAEIMKANTYDAKVNKNVNFSGVPEVTVAGTKDTSAADAGQVKELASDKK